MARPSGIVTSSYSMLEIDFFVAHIWYSESTNFRWEQVEGQQFFLALTLF